jgi:hypothetical protein
VTSIRDEFGRRRRQTALLWRTAGARGLAAKLLRAASQKLEQPNLTTGVRGVDVMRADLASTSAPPPPPPLPVGPDGRLTLNWVMTAPHEGSGGHTTAFRLIRHLQEQGHRCRIALYDVYGGDFAYHRSIVQRAYADTSTEVTNVVDGLEDAHGVFATSWETAYPVFNSTAAGRRFYLVQDFEPWFYPSGSVSVLAENTYRMGFHGITAGAWLPRILADRFDMPADGFAFGCDTNVYRLGSEVRDGVVFYARPAAPRRAFELGVMALELFHLAHPDITIHCYGDAVRHLGFPVVDHGLVSPGELDSIYNRCFAGLSLSITNVSLVPHEMLASGCIPVVNEAEHNRIVLDNDLVVYARATPHDLARALGDVVMTHQAASLGERATASVANASWYDAARTVEAVIEREVAASVQSASSSTSGWS